MPRRHNVTANTYKKLLFDQAEVFKNWGEGSELRLGATRGGSSFVVEEDLRTMDVDGAKSDVKGDKRIVRVGYLVTVNFVEFSPEIWQLALPGSSVADYPDTPSKTHDQITRALQILLADYTTNVAIIGEVTGNSTNGCELILDNALAGGGWEVGFVPGDESILPITFRAHQDPSDIDTEPFKIRWPTIA